jgi:aminoglycoside phosphotransferase (APT) family kinase protein
VDLPSDVRGRLEHRLGSTVVEAVTQPTGFSPGVASRLLLADGRRVFLKAVHESANPDSPDIYRREAEVVAALPAAAPVPAFHWSFDEQGWVALCFEDVDGRHPHEPWTEPDLSLVAATLQKMASILTPSPFQTDWTAARAFERGINGWRRALAREAKGLDDWCRRHLAQLARLEDRAPGMSSGDTLLHFDTRADNLLIAGDRVYVLDWPWARIGAAWIDWVAMAPSVTMQGGPPPEDFMSRFDMSGVSPAALDAVLCTIAGYFAVTALEPPPPGLPTLRAFQAAQGRVAIAWLRARTGWD